MAASPNEIDAYQLGAFSYLHFGLRLGGPYLLQCRCNKATGNPVCKAYFQYLPYVVFDDEVI